MPTYTMRLAHGVSIGLTDVEKFQYDTARIQHEKAMSLIEIAIRAQQTGQNPFPRKRA
jgi:hypothetical protein